jgi:hypothetical protein
MPAGTRSFAGNHHRILYALIAVAIAIGFGAAGFYLIEGWSILDSLYVAAQTVTTVGYGDLTPATVQRPKSELQERASFRMRTCPPRAAGCPI